MFRARRDTRVQQVHGVGDVVTEVLAGMDHAGGNERVRRKMHYRVGSHTLETLLHHGTVGQVAFDELRARIDRSPMSFAQVVENSDLVTRIQQFLDTNTSHIAELRR